MVALRLTRVGKKNHSTFRLVASDKQKDTLGMALEILGSYDPHHNPPKVVLNVDRVKYWLSVGAQPSDSVHNLLVDQGILTAPKRIIVKVPAKTEETPAAEPASAPSADAPTETPAA